jgi:iron-sulfur cluster repair protein YtfE (RIC family)
MSDLGELVPSTETRKKKRGSGFRFSSKKVIDLSRLAKKTAKAGGSEFNSVAKVLTLLSALSSEIDHPHCVTGGQNLFDSILEADGLRVESSFANMVSNHLQWRCRN